MIYDYDAFFAPHYSKKTIEIFNLLYGRIDCIIFDTKGFVKKIIHLNNIKNSIILAKKTIHTYKIVSKKAVAHEMLEGPFMKNNVFIPKWYEQNKDYYLKIIK